MSTWVIIAFGAMFGIGLDYLRVIAKALKMQCTQLNRIEDRLVELKSQLAIISARADRQ